MHDDGSGCFREYYDVSLGSGSAVEHRERGYAVATLNDAETVLFEVEIE